MVAGANTRPRRQTLRGLALAASLAVAAFGCAGKQKIPLDLSPPGAEVYVDGKKIKGDASEINLAVDRDHKVFVKNDGFRSELIVIRSVEEEGEARLSPPSVAVELVPLSRTRMDVEIGIDPEEEPGADD